MYGTHYSKIITIEHNFPLLTTRGGQNTISDTNKNVYIIQNQLLYMFFTSAELYNYLNTGKRYKITGYGLRIPILNMYPNILSAKEIH